MQRGALWQAEECERAVRRPRVRLKDAPPCCAVGLKTKARNGRQHVGLAPEHTHYSCVHLPSMQVEALSVEAAANELT